MNAGIGHNNGPDLEGRPQSLRTRWAKALFADPTTPDYVMAIAWAVHWYSNSSGGGAALSNAQLEVICGISSRTATRGKAWLRDAGYVQLKVGTGDEKTRFQMVIPEAVKIDGVATQATLEGSHTGGGATLATLGSQTVHPRVATQATSIQERDSGLNPEVRRVEKPLENQGRSLWQEALNPDAAAHDSVVFQNGKLKLLNGTKQEWLKQFGDDEIGLDLALMEIAPFIQPNSNRSLQVQVVSKLARAVRDKRDKDSRYAQAAKANRTTARPKSGQGVF